MEGLSNQNNFGSAESHSDVELSLYGFDKKWVRSNGTWVDKSQLPSVTVSERPSMDLMEMEDDSSAWWKFWKA